MRPDLLIGIVCAGWWTWRRQIFFPLELRNAHFRVNMLSFMISPTATYIISSVIRGATGSSIISWLYASTIGALKWWNPIWELAGIGLTTAMTRSIDGKVNDYCTELATVSSHGHSTIHSLKLYISNFSLLSLSLFIKITNNPLQLSIPRFKNKNKKQKLSIFRFKTFQRTCN